MKVSDLLRSEFKKNDDLRDAGLTTPENIVRYDDILYGDDPEWQVLDVYRPKAAEGQKLPVIVSVHGGGWVYGSKERYQFYCMSLAQRGFAVVNFTYRLAPENKYPAPLEDTNRVFAWVLSNAERYGFDKDHIFGVGDSAGAHTLALYACICTNPAYAAEYSFRPPKGLAFTAIALNCGVFRIDMTPKNTTADLMAAYLPGQGTEKELELINVPAHITRGFPPTFLMTATGDHLKAQAPIAAAKLTAENVPFLYRCYGDAKNLLPHVFHCDIKSVAAKLCNDEECEFFRKFL